MTIKTLLVDDEPMARRKLQRFLRDEPDFVVVGEAENPKDAARQIRAICPDLVFLDIVMPGGEGFDALDGLDRKMLPHIVFVTAFDAHAVRAFDIQAVDYLLKPFDRRRFRQTLAKVRRSVESADVRERLAALLAQRRVEQENPDRLLVRDGDRLVLVPFRSIDRVESQGNDLKLHAGVRSYVVRETMKRLLTRLPEDQFLRVHRSHIVNLDRVVEIHTMFRGDAEIHLKNGVRIPLSRHYRSGLNRYHL